MSNNTIRDNLEDVLTVRTIALAAAFTAMVFVATFLFAMSIPASSGYFNLGEAFVYLAALIGGPFVGAIAGGLGAALADAILAPFFIPATLVFKGAEGFAVGAIYRYSGKLNRTIRLITLLVLSILLIVIPIYITTPSLNGISGSDVLTIGSPDIFSIDIPGFFLVILAGILCVILWISSFLLDEKGHIALTCMLSGIIIIVGYFSYEIVVLNTGIEAAFAELPFNILQVLIGAFITIPVFTYLQELGIIKGSEEESSE